MSTCYWNMFERKNRIYHGIIASFVLDLTWVDAKRKSWKVDLILLLIDNFINWISIQYYFHSKRKNLPMTCRRLSQMTLTGITFLPNPAQQRQTIMNRIRFFRPFAFALINFQKTKTKPQFRENWRKAKSNLKCWALSIDPLLQAYNSPDVSPPRWSSKLRWLLLDYFLIHTWFLLE